MRVTRSQKRKLEANDRRLEVKLSRYYGDEEDGTLVQDGNDKDRWIEDLNAIQSKKRHARSNATMYASAFSQGTGHTLTSQWLPDLQYVSLALRDTGVSVVDMSAAAGTLKGIWVEIHCVQSLKITGLHKCSKLSWIGICCKDRPYEVHPNTRPMVNVVASTKLTLLDRLNSMEIDSRNVTRFPVELAASPALVQFGVNTRSSLAGSCLARQAHCLFKLYLATLHGLKQRYTSPNKPWIKLAFRGPLRDPSVLVEVAHLLCPMLKLPSNQTWDTDPYECTCIATQQR